MTTPASIPATPAPPSGRPLAPTKAETALLPPFEGLPLDRIHVPDSEDAFEAAAREIEVAGVVGFDTESRPTFEVGQKSQGPHVLQFALDDRAFLFQMHRPGCREVAARLLESERITKVGFGLGNDHGQIRSKFGVTPRAVVDLEHVFRKRGYHRQIGVRAAIGVMLGRNFPKSKSVTTSNWAARQLTPRQMLYAANDAYAALAVMRAIEQSDHSRGMSSAGS